MPGEFSRIGAIQALNGGWPLDTYLVLCTSAPGDYALGAEYTAAGYGRQAMRRSSVATDTDPPVLSNQDRVVFGPFTAATGAEVGWLMAMTGAAGGTVANMVAYWELDEHKTPVPGDSLILEVGALSLSCT